MHLANALIYLIILAFLGSQEWNQPSLLLVLFVILCPYLSPIHLTADVRQFTVEYSAVIYTYWHYNCLDCTVYYSEKTMDSSKDWQYGRDDWLAFKHLPLYCYLRPLTRFFKNPTSHVNANTNRKGLKQLICPNNLPWSFLWHERYL